MFSELQIEGLKSFSGWESAELAPITLIFGDNSAGKSSLLQSGLLLSQTVCGSRDGGLIATGANADLGGFANLVHGHDASRPLQLGCVVRTDRRRRDAASHRIGLRFRADGRGGARLDGLELEWSAAGSGAGLRLVQRTDPHEDRPVEAFVPPDGDWPAAFAEWLTVVLGPRLSVPAAWRFCRDAAVAAHRSLDEDAEEWAGFAASDVLEALQTMRPRFVSGSQAEAGRWLPRRLERHAVPQGSAIHGAVAAAIDAVLSRCADVPRSQLERIVHLGPTRDIPERVFPLRGAPSEMRRLAHDPGLLDRVNTHLRHLEVPYDLTPVLLGRDDVLLEDAVALRLLDQRYEPPLPVNLRDVGVGISQLLPIIVSAVANPGGTVLIEQPELHVHPGLQAKLGDTLVSESDHTQFIIETHSEHLMLRLLRYVRHGRLDPDDVSVLYVQHDGQGAGANVRRLEIDEAGDFVQRWPGGFFTEREHELFDEDLEELV